MATPPPLEEGTIIRTNDGQDAVIINYIDSAFGYREYVVLLVDSGQTRMLTHREFDVVDRLDDLFELDLDVDMSPKVPMPAETDPLPTIKPPVRRFAKIDNDNDVDKLAESRLSANTKRQNQWAVRVFHGMYLF